MEQLKLFRESREEKLEKEVQRLQALCEENKIKNDQIEKLCHSIRKGLFAHVAPYIKSMDAIKMDHEYVKAAICRGIK